MRLTPLRLGVGGMRLLWSKIIYITERAKHTHTHTNTHTQLPFSRRTKSKIKQEKKKSKNRKSSISNDKQRHLGRLPFWSRSIYSWPRGGKTAMALLDLTPGQHQREQRDSSSEWLCVCEWVSKWVWVCVCVCVCLWRCVFIDRTSVTVWQRQLPALTGGWVIALSQRGAWLECHRDSEHLLADEGPLPTFI